MEPPSWIEGVRIIWDDEKWLIIKMNKGLYMGKERREKIKVTDPTTEKRVLISNIIASLIVVFLAYISFQTTLLSISSQVQATELVNLNQKLVDAVGGIRADLNRHIDNDRMHPYKHQVRAKAE